MTEKKRGIELTDEELLAKLEAAKTGVLTTLRRDGRPVTLPVWFVFHEGAVFVRTPPSSMKVKRIRHDARGSFLVESGVDWTELCAATFPVEASILEPGEESAAVMALLDRKYEEHALPLDRAPRAVAAHYGQEVIVRLSVAGPIVSWDNSKIKLKSPST